MTPTAKKRFSFRQFYADRIREWPTLAAVEARYIAAALRESGWNLALVARQLEVRVDTLSRRCKRLGVRTTPTEEEREQLLVDRVRMQLSRRRAA